MLTPTTDRPKRGLQCQPLDVVNIDDARLNIRTVEALVGHKKSWIYAEIKKGAFPAPDEYARWLSNDIRSYLRCRREGIAWPPVETSIGVQ